MYLTQNSLVIYIYLFIYIHSFIHFLKNCLFHTGESSFVIQSRDINCNITRNSKYDMGSYELQAGVSYKDYFASSNCSKLLNPEIIFPHHYASFKNDISTFEIDTRTFVISLAVSEIFKNFFDIKIHVYK